MKALSGPVFYLLYNKLWSLTNHVISITWFWSHCSHTFLISSFLKCLKRTTALDHQWSLLTVSESKGFFNDVKFNLEIQHHRS